ncbi:MAG: GNAT family N-acetyltransferase [Tistlia sp.]|uniref:GNAT family N-acetyltransferase n=1 Tax=Tistlia sp. TaxID=3057121 RepID=UPI0034A4506A
MVDAAPAEILTERLRLRPPRLEDVEAHLEMDRDPEVMRFVEPLPGSPPDLEAKRRRLLERIESGWPAVGRQFYVAARDGGEFLGWCALFPLEDRAGQPVEIGYRYRRAAWGRGVATEAAAALLRFGFETLGLDPIVGVTDHANRGSQAVLAKVGLRRAGNIRAYGEDVAFFVAHRAGWLAAQSGGSGR